MKNFHLLLVAYLLVATSCATTSKDFKADSLKPNEGAVYGHVKVIYNGADKTDQCSVCFNSVNGPCLKLEQGGLVVMKLDAGHSSIRRVACLDTSVYHYNLEGANFELAPKSKTYFGDVSFIWTTKGGFKSASMFGAIGAVVDESSNDGTIIMSVSEDSAKAAQLYRDLAGESNHLEPARSIIMIGR